MFMKETQLAIEADAMGFDFVAPTEHHFFDYSISPDNAQWLSYLAAKTKQITLMPAAFILPWNDPLRVAEKTILLDILSEGRAMLGMGRGLARREFNGFRTDPGESRERFDEAAAMIIEALETGFMEGDGKFYKQPRVELRPRPVKSFKGRAIMAGMSPTSVESAARLGVQCLKFSNIPYDQALPEINTYRNSFRKHHGFEAPPILCTDYISCFDDMKKAVEYKDKYLAEVWRIVMNHYEMFGDHFATTKGYDSYVEASKELNKLGQEAAMNQWANANLFGTPEVILEKIKMRWDMLGGFDIGINPSGGSMPYEDCYKQMKLFADKVMPHIKGWEHPKVAVAVEAAVPAFPA